MFKKILTISALSLVISSSFAAEIYTVKPKNSSPVKVKMTVKSARVKAPQMAAANASVKRTGGIQALTAGGCMEEEEESNCGAGGSVTEFEFNYDYFDFILQSQQSVFAVVTLPPVEVGGCMVSVSGPWGNGLASCDGIQDIGGLNGLDTAEKGVFREIVDTVREVYRDLTDVLPPKLEQCPKVAAPNMTATADKLNNYGAASDAFLSTYGGALPGINNLQSVDIKYPDGFTFTFRVLWIEFGEKPKVKLFDPVLNESPSKEVNKCAA